MNRVELLSRDHDRQGFDCGETDLNVYLRTTARQHMEKQIAQTYVIVSDASTPPKPVIGFYTLGPCEIVSTEISVTYAQKFPTRIPAFRLGRLAISEKWQGQGFGKTMLIAALKNCFQASSLVGGTIIIVDAKNASAAGFYSHFGFLPFHSEPLKLFLPVATLKALFANEGVVKESPVSQMGLGSLRKSSGLPVLSPHAETEAMEKSVADAVIEKSRKLQGKQGGEI